MSTHIVGVEPKEYNGRKYRSTLEARTAEILDTLGLSWEYETKKLILQEGFRCKYQKDKVRSIEYIPDFIVGNIMIETKGFETPDWKIKKKLLYRYLSEKEPDALFYMVKSTKQLIEALDNHWKELGFIVQVKDKKGNIFQYGSILEAMQSLKLENKYITPIIKSLTGKKEYAYNYNWKLIKTKSD